MDFVQQMSAPTNFTWIFVENPNCTCPSEGFLCARPEDFLAPIECFPALLVGSGPFQLRELFGQQPPPSPPPNMHCQFWAFFLLQLVMLAFVMFITVVLVFGRRAVCRLLCCQRGRKQNARGNANGMEMQQMAAPMPDALVIDCRPKHISSAAVDAEIAEMRSIVETVQEVVKNVVEE